MDRETRWDGARRPVDLTPRRREPGVGTLLLVAAVSMLIVSVSLLYERPRPGELLESVPGEVLGRWVTADPRYADRELLVGADSLSLGLGGEGAPVRGGVVEIRTWAESGAVVYSVLYTVGEDEYVLDLHMESPDRMHLANPSEVIWMRVR